MTLAPLHVKFFIRIAYQDSWMAERFSRRGPLTPCVVLCDQEDESMNNILIGSPLLCTIWYEVLAQIQSIHPSVELGSRIGEMRPPLCPYSRAQRHVNDDYADGLADLETSQCGSLRRCALGHRQPARHGLGGCQAVGAGKRYGAWRCTF